MTERLESPTAPLTWEAMLASPPQGNLLADGDYSIMVTAAGTGFSQCRDQLLTRWDGDPIQDAHGLFFYLRDLDRGKVWSAGHQPMRSRPDHYLAAFEDGRAILRRGDDGILSTLEIAVIPGGQAEARRLTLVNTTALARRIEVTSYLEAVLNEREADLAHPGFSKLFVQTEWLPEERLLLARRRPRSSEERPRWIYHWICAPGPLEFETDRAAFLGRGRGAGDPQALAGPLSGSVGNVLDPVLALRCVVDLPPGATRVVAFGLGFADEREAALGVSARYGEGAAFEEAFQAAARHARVEREELGLSAGQARDLDQVAVDLWYNRVEAATEGTAPGTVLPRVKGLDPSPAEGPFVLVPLAGQDPAGLLARLEQARVHWRRKGFRPFVLILGSQAPLPGPAGLWEGPDPCAYLTEGELSPAERATLERRATLVVNGDFPRPLPLGAGASPEARWRPLRGRDVEPGPSIPTVLDNGWGGFVPDGTEYLIRIRPRPDGYPDLPPMPWSNVIANETFGFLTTERGPGTTWGANSRLHRVTPWFNDPVADPAPEAFYLRDEDSLEYWSPTPGPVASGLPCLVRHGFGTTSWETRGPGLEQEVTTFAARLEPLKFTRVRLRNTGGGKRKLSLFWYAHLALGDSPAPATPWVDTAREPEGLLAWNLQDRPLRGQVAFAAVTPGRDRRTFTTDRSAFLGRFGSLDRPRAVTCGTGLDGALGARPDPCFAFQLELELEPGESRDYVFLCGEAGDAAQARRLLVTYGESSAAERELEDVRAFWRETLGRVHLQSPDPALDFMVNGWLPYQNLTCRMWGRTAYYQSGGAFGFRDQLQDAAALIYLLPDLTRRQILLHAAHQFVEGDVLHWWHPPIEQGIRTRFSDDLLWLPYLTAFYLQSTGDWGLLDEEVPYLTARLLGPEEDEAYLAPTDSGQRGDLYEHCCKALDRSLGRFGVQGLPLMGTGDWNDGMNRVGRGGQGESVWMGFFLYAILDGFLPLCERRGDASRAAGYRGRMAELALALESAGWDGEWYRRAYYDDGTPLGSAGNEECRIDCLAQAWAVISKAVPPARARQAMAAMEEHLVDDGAQMIRLLAPAFDTCSHDPGYIKGYLPGVRENGGQYTHGALWAVRATAEMGDTTRAAELLAMLSPVTHGGTRESEQVYQIEPYVIAADIYGVAPLVGRGGWSWYTGSAGWMYRVALEDILGFQLHGGDAIHLRPRLPAGWDKTSLGYRTPDGLGFCAITVERTPWTGLSATLDGNPLPMDGELLRVPLARDGRVHAVRVRVGG